MERSSTSSPPPSSVVVGFDREPLGMTALDAALALVRDRGPVRVHVIHVRSPTITSSALLGLTAPAPVPIPREEPVATARERLAKSIHEHVEKRALDRSVEIVVSVCVGTSSSVLLEKARELGAGLVVVGTHRKGVFARLLEGSVSQTVVRDSPCPVLVVHEHDLLETMTPAPAEGERDTDPELVGRPETT